MDHLKWLLIIVKQWIFKQISVLSSSADDAQPDKLSIVNCTEDELKVELSKPTPEAGKAALDALERALQDYREGMIDVLVTAPYQ